MGKKLEATQKSYNDAFRKHIQAYINLKDGCRNSRCLLLCYSVECGLKCLIMKNNRIYTTTQADNQLGDILGTHDLRKLLGELHQAGNYALENTVTAKGENVHPEQYHQVYRYCIPLRGDRIMDTQRFENTLNNIVDWLKEEI